MKMRIPFLMLCVLVVLNLILAGCGAQVSAETPTPYPTPVRKTYTVQRGDIVINVELFGRVSPLALAKVHFQMDGHVANVYVQVNDMVKKGQLLADLDELKTLQSQSLEIIDAIKRAQIAVDIAQLTLDKYKAEQASSYDIQIQEKQVELAQMDLNDVLVKYGIDPTTNALDVLASAANKAKVFAPVDGMIISAVNAGRVVSITTDAFTIGDSLHSEIIATVDPGSLDETLKNMFEEMPVDVSSNSKPDLHWTGKVRQLPSPYGTGSADDKTIHIVLDQTPPVGDMKFGDTVTVQVQLANKKGILWLPPAAIHEVGGRTFVIVDGTNGPQRIDIEPGLTTTEKVEIISGLDEGQVVLGQ